MKDSAGARLAFAAALTLAAAPAFAATSFKQPGFSQTVVFSGLTNPTTIRFLPDGRVLVAEKNGFIKMFDSLEDTTPATVVDLRPKVHNFWDRGLLGLEVDPNFASNGYIYTLYTHDAPIGGTAPTWGPGDGISDPCPTPPGPTTDGCVVSGHLSRLTAAGEDWTASEQILIEDWCQQFPSHSMGAIAFGADGYLYMSAGDGASFFNQDWGQFGGTSGFPPPTPKNPCGDPPVPVGGNQTPPTAEGGALRSQSPRRTAGEPRVLNGAILRVDPATGAAAPGNPFAASLDPNEQRIIGYGLRNPFRIAIRPGTNDVYIADVGWSSWEELNRLPDLATARNYGWPCFEGGGTQYSGFQICPPAGEVTPAFFSYHHSFIVAPGDGCPTGGSAISGMAFYLGGSNYPAGYANALLFSDYTRRCMWVMFPGESGEPDPSAVAPFASSAENPVDVQRGPDGNLYYVDFDGGRVFRIEYGLNAVATAEPASGEVPLEVQFDGSGSQPAQAGDTLSFAWDLDGDGEFDDSTETAPRKTYATGGVFAAALRVTDQRGGSDVSPPIPIEASAGNPTATILTPSAILTWKVGDVITFSGAGSDPQDGTLDASALSWSVILHHCPSTCHTHTYQTFAGVDSGSFAAPDHEYPAYLEIELTATDSDGLTGTSSLDLNPQTVDLTLASSPAGLQLSSGTSTGAAPFVQTVIVGSENTLIAPSPQGAYPAIWEFAAWSDGGAQSHTITAPAVPATYTATFAVHADLSITMDAAPDPVCQGEPITYTLQVANAGPSRAVAVTVVDTLPEGSTLVSAGGTDWSCGTSAPVICTLPALDLSAAAPITLVVTAPPGPELAVNSATVGSTTTDVSGGDNAASESTAVNGGPAAPSISAPDSAAVGETGLAASVTGHPGSTYAWTLSGGTITAGQGSNAITFDAGAPGTTMDLRVVESNGPCPSLPASRKIQVDFLDVPPDHPFHDFVSTVAREGVTAGCGNGNYCPDASVTRAQMAVFLLKAKLGADHVAPAATGAVFGDVPASDPFAPWIEELAELGVTGGCGAGNFCPEAPVTRAQMAVFLLKALEGPGYAPPAATGSVFVDVPQGSFAADWIEELASRGVTGGCGNGNYCPGLPNTRGQMAVFLVRTFGL